MEHLVESHFGGYYVSSEAEDIIEAYCEQCGDYDKIILSWKDGEKQETLEKHFSILKITEEEMKSYLDNGITKDNIIDRLMHYYNSDRQLVKYLLKVKIISEEEKLSLFDKIEISQNRQFSLVKYFFDETLNKRLVKHK